jgi:hypothetical protein
MAHIRISLPDGMGFALLSDHELTDTAIIYVHGFWGGPESTWENIVYYVDRLGGAPFERSDLFFFDYPAQKDFLIASVSFFRRFLSMIYPNPPEDLFSVPLRDIDWRLQGTEGLWLTVRHPQPYVRAILVGHSLGAVVIRRFIADEIFQLESAEAIEPHSILRAQLRLFAPAHLGFHPAAIKKVLWSAPYVGPLFHAIADGNRAFEDLTENCAALTQLRREIEKAASDFPAVEALRPYVMWGRREDVVVVGRYDSDPPRRIEEDPPDKDHVEICKIRADYDRAAYFVAAYRELSA